MPSEPEFETRQDRRERKRQSRRDKGQKHGKGIGQMYLNALLKRLKRSK